MPTQLDGQTFIFFFDLVDFNILCLTLVSLINMGFQSPSHGSQLGGEVYWSPEPNFPCDFQTDILASPLGLVQHAKDELLVLLDIDGGCLDHSAEIVKERMNIACSQSQSIVEETQKRLVVAPKTLISVTPAILDHHDSTAHLNHHFPEMTVQKEPIGMGRVNLEEPTLEVESMQEVEVCSGKSLRPCPKH